VERLTCGNRVWWNEWNQLRPAGRPDRCSGVSAGHDLAGVCVSRVERAGSTRSTGSISRARRAVCGRRAAM